MKLDLKDKKILTELEMNARMPLSELAKKVRLSKQVITYRVDKLKKENIIQQFYAIIDMAKLGLTPYVIYFKFHHLSSQNELKWIKDINKDSSVLASGKNAGQWDLTILIQAKNNNEVDEILNRITANKKDKIQKITITSQIEADYFNLRLLYNKTTKEAITKGGEIIDIDEKNNKLLQELAKNCRQSLIELSKKIKLSPNGVKERIKGLEKKKIIVGYRTKINYQKLGYLHFRVFLHLKNMNPNLYSRLKVFLKDKGNVESVGRFIGYADFDFRCHVKTIVDLYQLISSIKDNFINEVISIDSVINFGWESINYYPKK